MTESEIQTQILNWLYKSGILRWRCNIGGVRVKGATVRNPMRGFPDIAGIIPGTIGHLFVIEVKTETGRLSVDQETWRANLESAGALYILARSLDDVTRVLTKSERLGA